MDDLFNEDSVDQTVDVKLEDLVGEDKKFKSVEDLARGKAEADSFIERLKRENEELRKDLGTRLSLEEFMTKMDEKKSKQGEDQGNQSLDNRSVEPDSKFDPADLEKLLDEKLTAAERKRQEDANLQAVQQKLVSTWGDNAGLELKRKASELGMATKELEAFAKTNPAAFFRLVGIDAQRQQSSAGFVNTGVDASKTQATTGGNTKNKAYYDKLRAENPREYWTPKIQNEMFQMAVKLGDNFYT